MRKPFKSSPTSSLSSSPSNISNTLSSIQNTIKILDYACQKTDHPERKVESNREWYKASRFEASPVFRVNDVKVESLLDSEVTSITSRRWFDDNKREPSKIASRSPSPCRYTAKSPSSSVYIARSPSASGYLGENPSPSRYSTNPSPSRFSVKTPEIDPAYVAKLRYLSTEEYIAGRKSPSKDGYDYSDSKLRIDRSPTSPGLMSSTLYSNTARQESSYSLRYPSKSAENSPSRHSAGQIESSSDSMFNLSYQRSKKY